MNTLKNLIKLHIAGMLSEAAKLEVERRIKEHLQETNAEEQDVFNFG